MTDTARAATAHTVATALHSGEIALEKALAETGGLIAALAGHRQETGLSVFHCQDALEDAMGVAALLTQARRSFGGLHRRLEATSRQIGLDPKAYGPTEKPPEIDVAPRPVEAPLRRVV
jgi:hypothetical protein